MAKCCRGRRVHALAARVRADLALVIDADRGDSHMAGPRTLARVFSSTQHRDVSTPRANHGGHHLPYPSPRDTAGHTTPHASFALPGRHTGLRRPIGVGLLAVP